jgi:outer membrane receptor protein involved in Fe transport
MAGEMKRWGGCLLALLAIAAVLQVPAALAQTESGKVTGTVMDQSRAVLPGALVSLKSVDRATTRTAVTDARGVYVFANLVPGPYEISVSLKGFSTKQIKVTLPVGATIDVDASLQVGEQTEIVNVVGETELINTTTQDIATNVDERQIRELPTITRNPYDLVQLSGNVNDSAYVDGGSQRGVLYSINGQRAASTNVLLDGSANNDEFTAGVGQDVPLEAVQEFTVITSNFSAQFGRATGGVVNVATKSGTNQLRGTVYEFFRSDNLAANTFDNNARGLEKADFTRSQAGFSLGGPILKDKLHFFSSLEYIRVRSTTPVTHWVVTPEFLARTSPTTQSFFSKYSVAGTPNGVLMTRGAVPGQSASGPFSQLPADLPVFQQVEYNVNSDGGGGTPRNDYQWVLRFDYNFGPKTTAYVRWAGQDAKGLEGSNSDSPYAGFNTDYTVKNHNVLGSLTHTFSPTLTSQTKLVYNNLATEQPLGENPAGPTLYMSNTTVYSLQGVSVAFPGYLPFNPGTAIPFGGPQKLIQFYEDMSWLKGAHDFRFGGSFVRILDDRTFGAYENPVEALGGNSVSAGLDNLVRGQIVTFQAAVNPQGKFPGETISLPVSFPSFTRNNRYNEWALYANDAWSVTRNLKLNLGVRYEYFGVQKNKDSSLDSNFYFGSGSSYYETVRNGSVKLADAMGGLWKPDKDNFGPRLGFAWDVLGDGKTSIRGGWGISYERNFGNVTFNVIQNPPNYAVISLSAPGDLSSMPIYTDPAGPLGGTGSKKLPAVTLRAVDPDIVNAWAQFWSLSAQRDLGHGLIGSIEYTGSKGSDLYSITNINRLGFGAEYFGDSSVFTRANKTYSLINFRTNGGRSMYHGVTFGLDSRQLASTGLSLTARFSLGWAKDNLSSTFSESSNETLANGLGFLDPLNPDLDYGWADFDVRRRFVASGIWEIPVAKNAHGLAKGLFGDWQANFIVSAQSGAPFSVADCSNGLEYYCARMAVVGPINGYIDTPSEDAVNTFNYLDVSNQESGFGSIYSELTGFNEVWTDATNIGTMSKRNAFRRPGRWNLDMSLSKRVRFSGSKAIQLRVEAYNLFNHANRYLNGSEAAIDYGPMITTYRDGQRRIQLGAKIEF